MRADLPTTNLASYKVLLYIFNQNGLLYYFLIAQSHRTCYLSLQQMQQFPIDFQFYVLYC